MGNRGLAVHPKFIAQVTHRSQAPEQTLELVAPLMESAGITRVAVVTGLDTLGIPVVMVTRPAGRCLSVTQGSGTTLMAAKVSGILEAIGHFHAEAIDAPLRYASFVDLEPEGAVDLTALVSVSRESLHHAPMLWITGESLRDGSKVWVPFELVHLDYRLPLPAGSGRFVASASGLASGVSLSEATGHALFAVVERHQAALFYGLDAWNQAARRLDLTSIDEPACRALVDQVTAAAVRVALWDLSETLGIPCFLCELIDEQPDVFRPLPRARGLGCHSNKGTALIRSITAAAQSRLTNIAGSRDDISTAGLGHASKAEHWEEARRRHTHGARERAYAAIPSFQFNNFEQQNEWLVERLTKAGFGEGVVVDLSKSGWPISVVRVVVPGLLHADPMGPQGGVW